MGGNSSNNKKTDEKRRELLPDEYVCPHCGNIHKRKVKLLKQNNKEDINILNLLNDNEINYILKNIEDKNKLVLHKGKNSKIYRCQKDKNLVAIKRITLTNLSTKNSISSKVKIFSESNSKNSLKIIESYILKESHKNKEKQKEYLYIITECCEGNLQKYLSDVLQRQKLTVKEISDILCQISNSLYDIYNHEPKMINEYIDMKNILYTKKNVFKFNPNFHALNNEDNNYLLPPEILEGKDIDLEEKTDIWYLGLLIYRLYKGKDLNYENNYETLINKIYGNIMEFNDFIENNEHNANLDKTLKLFHDLVKKCLTINEENRYNFNQFISHPFFNSISKGRIEDKERTYKEGEEKDFLNISLFNLPKIFLKQLDLKSLEDKIESFDNLDEYLIDFEEIIKNEDMKDKLKHVIIYKFLESENENDNYIKNILKSINRAKETYFDFMLPFIIFMAKNKKLLETKINKIIADEELNFLDKRFLFYCEDSNIIEIRNKIYRAYSFYNECGDIFNLGKNEIDLRKNKFDFYFNIICIARSQVGKSTFINRFISSFNSENIDEIRAKEGGNERACSSKFAQYYVNNYPLKLIDIIGYDGEQDTVEKLNEIVNNMSIILEQNEIHIILYLINFDCNNLFFPSEVKIFERLRLNAIKPKLLFIRTQCKFNIYKGSENESHYNSDNLNPREKQAIKLKIQAMNTNFKTIKQGNEWKNIIKYIFSKEDNQGPDYFNLDNVCFMNLVVKEETTGEDIPPFGMKYFKHKIYDLLQEIRKEEEVRAEKWLKLQEKLKDDNANIVDIIKEMNFYNIYTKSLTEEESELHKSLVENNINSRIKIDIQDIPDIMILLLEKGIFFMINFFNYRITKNKENNTTNNFINKKRFKNILNDFITYKTTGISSIDYYFRKNQEDNNVINDILLNKDNQEKNQEINQKKQLNDNNLISENSIHLNNISVDKVIDNLNGIKNNKNESFMISVLQCLIHCKPFISFIFKEKGAIKNLSKEFFNLCIILASNNLISLKHFKSSINENSFIKGDFIKPIKFLTYFLERINKEIYNKNNEYNKIKYENISKIDSCNKYYEKYIKNQKNNGVENNFYIHFISSLVCKECKHEIILFEEDIKLLLAYNNDIDLRLIDYSKEEEIDNNCTNCNKDTRHTKKKIIYYTPEILTLYIQNSKKNMMFDETLKIKIFKEENNEINYKLISFINSEKEGEENVNYHSFINIQNKWYNFKDKSVNEVKLDFAESCPSVLFYQIMNNN